MSATAEHLLTLQEDNLPPGWTLATIEDLVGKGGVFIDGDWVESKDQDPEGDIRLIQLADVGDGEYRNKSARFLTYERAIQLGCTFLQKGDVLIARMPDPLGRACIFPGDTKSAVTVVDVAVVRSAAGEFNHRWLMYFVNAPAFRAVVASMQSGSTRKRISRGNLAKIALPVPPLDQQKSIVAEIEKQFSRLDEAVTNLKRVKANLKRYKAAVLKAAVEGRLVETEAELARREGRSYETGAQLLQRILETRRSQWKGKGKYKEPTAPDTTDLPELPAGWTWCGFEQVSVADKHALKAGPFGSALKKEFYAESGYKIYGQEQVIRGNSTYGDYYIDEKKYRELESCAVKPGDLLISLVGTTGKVLVLPQNAMPGIINPRLLKLSLNNTHIAPKYAAYMLQSASVSHYFKLQAHGGTMEILNLGIIKALPVPLPPIAEQYRVVAEVDRRLSLVREIDAQIENNLVRAKRLHESVLKKAFEGGLVEESQSAMPSPQLAFQG